MMHQIHPARGTFSSTFGSHVSGYERISHGNTQPRAKCCWGRAGQGREAVQAVSEVRDNVAIAIDKSLKRRPYTTLALTLVFGFVLGAMWAR
jgi:hypothetical protein